MTTSNSEIKQLIEELYQSDLKIYDKDKNPITMPEKGSLGLLAIGYKGIIAWKKLYKSQKNKA